MSPRVIALEGEPGSGDGHVTQRSRASGGATVHLAPGEHEILVRAWDSSAATQPEEHATLWNPKGYVNNARPHVRVRATAV